MTIQTVLMRSGCCSLGSCPNNDSAEEPLRRLLGFGLDTKAAERDRRATNRPTNCRCAFSRAYKSSPAASGIETLPGTLTLPNGATIAMNYDFAARLTNTTLRRPQQAILNHHGYGYNAASQRTTEGNGVKH